MPLNNQTLMPFIVAALVFGVIFMMIMGTSLIIAGWKSWTRQRLERYAGDAPLADTDEDTAVLKDRRFSRFNMLNRFLSDSPMAQATATRLVQARMPLKVGEYLVIRVVSAAILAYVLAILGGNVLAIVPGAITGYFLPHLYVEHRRKSRIKALEMQLVDALSLSANSLRAGWGFTQAMSQIATEMPAPISEEFTQVLQEVSIGQTPEEAIHNMVKRIDSYDVELVMTGVLIQRQIGGNLAEMMDNTVTTIRERIRLLGDIDSIIAESRLSMWLLTGLPVFILVFLAIAMPDYTLPFLEDPRGRLMLLAGGVFEVFGVIVMKRLSNVEV